MEKNIHFHNLDVLRFIFAAGVVLGHSYEGYFGWGLGQNMPDFFRSIKPSVDVFMGNLTLGVMAFFVVSGFLITYLLLNEKQQYGQVNIGKFILRRSLRIWPLYYLAIGLGFLFVTYLGYPHPDYLPNLLFWNNFHTIQILQWQYPFAHFWSLCVEEHFYLVWPVLLFLTPIKRVWIVVILLIAASAMFRYSLPGNIDAGKLYASLCLHTLSRMDEILFGALIACIHFHRPIVIRVKRWIRLCVYVLFIVVLFMQPQSDYWVWGIYSAVFKKYIYLLFIGFWIVNYLFNKDAFFRFTQKNFLHYLGKISFGIYVYHNMIIPVYFTWFVYYFNIQSMAAFFGFYFLFLLIISIISFELYEKYFLTIKERFALIKTQR
jgi:peptidoglycan/LPS O-acetylase OafA/YrhL